MTKIEDNGKNWPQILAVLLASLTQLSCGILFAWPSPSIPILTSHDYHLEISLEEASYLTVLPPIATILFSSPASKFIDYAGRKLALLFIALPHLIAWILVLVHNSIWWLYISRFINGIADACIYAALPVYIGEICTPEVRGTWGNAISFVLYIGIVIVNAVGAYFSIITTAYIFISIPIIYAATFAFMPETPYFLVSNGKIEEARKSLKWLRQKENVEDELGEIINAMKRQFDEPGTFKDLFLVEENKKAVIVGVVMRFTQQFCGIAAFETYCQHLFKEAGGDISESTSAIIFSGVMTVICIFASALMDQLGRRKSMHLSGVGCFVALIAIGSYLQLQISVYTWFPLAGMIIFIVFFAFGLGIVPVLMLGEIFSSNIKANALTVMNVFFGIFVAGSTKIFQLLMTYVGLYASFYFFGVCTLVGTIAGFFLIPETMGKTLEEIQIELKGSKREKNENC